MNHRATCFFRFDVIKLEVGYGLKLHKSAAVLLCGLTLNLLLSFSLAGGHSQHPEAEEALS